MERPLPLLYVNDEGKFSVGDEAASVIEKVKGKVAVIAIAGLYRTGKSYILNRLLGRQQGFEIGGTVNSCTKGIYTWGEPLKVKNENGEEVNVILMDTEGIGSFEQNQTHDAKIFSLSVLLSSYFIYNSMGVIDENALEKISFIANLTKHIHVHSPAGKDDEVDSQELAPYFPQFTWLLRDFGLKLVDADGNPITSRQYLESALTKQSKDKSKNELRTTITTVFPYRDCVTLVRPVVDEDELQNLDKVPYENLREKFRNDAEAFAKKILGKVKPKLVFGQSINGHAFLNLVKSYVEAINTGAVPTIRNAWESVSELENKQAVEDAVALYHSLLEKKIEQFPVEQDDLYTEHISVTIKSKELFHMRSLGEQKQSYLEQLEVKLGEEYEKIVHKNDSASEKKCKEILSIISNDVTEQLKQGAFPTCTDLAQEWKQLVDKIYLSEAKGKFKYISLSECLLQKMTDSLVVLDQSLLEKLKEEHTKERNQLRDEIREERDDKKKLREEYTEVKNDLRGIIEKNTSQIDSLQVAFDSTKKKLEVATAENEKLKKELNELKKTNETKSEKLEVVDSGNQVAIQMSDGKKKKKGNCVIQ